MVINLDCLYYITHNCMSKEERTLFRLVNKYFRDTIPGKVHIRSLMLNNNTETIKYLLQPYDTQTDTFKFIKNMICNISVDYDKHYIVTWVSNYTNIIPQSKNKSTKIYNNYYIDNSFLYGIVLFSLAKSLVIKK